jgi:tetratricopeptide (TPR) repeat protein
MVQIRRNRRGTMRIEQLISDSESLYAEKGKDKRALHKIEQALEINPKDTRALVIKGRILFQLNRTKEALKSYDQAITIDPKCSEAYLERARYYYALKQDNRRALQEIAKALSFAKRDQWIKFEGLRLRGNILGALDRDYEAIKAFRTAIKLGPRSAEVHCDLADSLAVLGWAKKALKHYDIALQIATSNSEQDAYETGDIIYRKVLTLNRLGLYDNSLCLIEWGLKRIRGKNARKDLKELRDETFQLRQKGKKARDVHKIIK